MRPRLPTAEKRSGNSAYPPSATETTAKSSMRRAFYEIIACVPYGKVATYGQIATLAGYPGRARQVGFALAGMPGESDLPWHRIINAQGKVSPRSGSSHLVQYELLASEGVVFTAQRIDLKRFGWRPEAED